MFKGKVVTITGGASGIGLSTVRLLAGKGATVVIGDIDQRRLDEAVSSLSAAGRKVSGFLTDVTDPGSQRKLVVAALGHSGVLDIHINNAGVVFPGPLEQIPDSEVERQVRVNLLGTIYGTREAVKVMRRQGFGHIVNVASLAGIAPLSGEAVYSGTKFAVRGFSLAAGMELGGAGIRVSVVCPDSTETPMLAFEALHDAPALSFSGRILRPEEVAGGILVALSKNKREVCLPTGRGWLAKVTSLVPGLLERILPLFERAGQQELERRRSQAKD